MRLVSLNCNQCGAPLEVPEKVQFVTCGYCSARLSIQRSGGAVYSQALDVVEKRTEQIADDLETIKLQSELASLDRQWMLDRDKYKVTGSDGEYSVPSQAGSIVGVIVVAGFGLFWTVTAVSMAAPIFFPLFGIVFVILAIIGGISSLNKAAAYQDSHRIYEARRRSLLQQMRERH